MKLNNYIVPSEYNNLIILPGIGDYTAKAILGIAFNKPVKCIICHENNETEEISLTHSYNNLQLEWFRAGSALNVMRHN